MYIWRFNDYCLISALGLVLPSIRLFHVHTFKHDFPLCPTADQTYYKIVAKRFSERMFHVHSCD